MKKVIILIGICMAMVLGATILFLSNTSKKNAASRAVEQTKDVQYNAESQSEVNAKTDTQSKRDKLMAQRKIFNLASNYANKQVEEENKDKEKEYHELHLLTQDHYFEMAPTVLGEMFEQQDANDSWTSSIQEEAEVFFSEENVVGTSLGSVDCRKSLCKVLFDHKDMESHDAFVNGIMNMGPWLRKSGDAMGGYSEQADGSIQSYVYFSNSGDFDTFWEMRKKMAEKITHAQTQS